MTRRPAGRRRPAAASAGRRLRASAPVAGYAPDVRHRFTQDPAGWLPEPLSMHGAATFRAPVAGFGVDVHREIEVGAPWVDGLVAARALRLRVVTDDGWRLPLPSVAGELVLEPLGDGDGCVLRFVGGVATVLRLPFATWLAGRDVTRTVTGIAARLAVDAPDPPSHAAVR